MTFQIQLDSEPPAPCRFRPGESGTGQRGTIIRALKASLVIWLSLLSTPGWSLELETVLENAAVVPPARVGFREERHNPLLKEPMVLTGYLEYLEAGRMRKVVDTPFREAFLVDQDRIEVERDGKIRKLSLRKSKLLKTMFGGIEAILSGHPDQLVSVFRYTLAGTSEAWSLQLEPISSRISRHLTALQVTGDEASVTSIRFELKGGEWHRMELIGAEPQELP